MLFEPASEREAPWDVDPSHDRAMLALQYVVAVIAVGAALLLSSVH
jgi:hypothetical protein